MNLRELKKMTLPKKPGSYRFYDKNGKVLYVGKAVNLHDRILSYWRTSADHSLAKKKMLAEVSSIKWIEVESEIEALLLEANLIKKYHPPYNILLRDDKRFSYVSINLDDPIPSPRIVRQLGRSGLYFGPFVSATAIKNTLKALRRIWPYCLEKKVSTKPCFYYQVGRCVGVCGGLVSRDDYLNNVIKPLILFFQGKKALIIKQYQKRLSQLNKKISKNSKPELIAWKQRLEYDLNNLHQVLATTKVVSLGEKYASDVIELAKIFSLTKIPSRIEGYDVSNIFGQQAVGSLVVFLNGEPDTNQYRKFKLQSTSNFPMNKKGDIQFLTEMVVRRLSHQEWPWPDMVVVDGAKAQVNLVQKLFKKVKPEILIVGLAKGEGLRSAKAPDKIYFAGETKPLILPLASPALHLLKRIRDEAHRFAIGYHRILRRHQLFK